MDWARSHLSDKHSRLVITWAVMACLAHPAAAQDVATTFEELRYRVKEGDAVFLTGEDGREKEARITELSASSLVVSMAGARHELTAAEIGRIRQRVPDRLLNGAVIGFAAGAATAISFAKALESPAGSCGAGCIAGNGLLSGGLGALAGMGIDALFKRKKTIYEPQRSATRIVVEPVLRGETTGCSFALRF